MISKELLSEVLECPTPSVMQQDIDNYLYYSGRHAGLSWRGEINIYELAHKCKQWAYTKKAISALDMYCDENNIHIEVIGFCDDGESGCLLHSANSKIEPEAVFKACQWILDNKAKDEHSKI